MRDEQINKISTKLEDIENEVKELVKNLCEVACDLRATHYMFLDSCEPSKTEAE